MSVSLLGLLLAGASCGGGGAKADGSTSPGTDGPVERSGGGDIGPIGSTPPAQCTGLIAIACSRLLECDSTATAQDEAACNKFLNVEFGCERATSAAFPACIQDARAISCAGLFPAGNLAFPGSCTGANGPLDIPPSDAQSKCGDLVGASCTHFYQCNGVMTPTAAQVSACIQNVVTSPTGVPCFDTISIGPKYAMCLNELKAAPCPPSADGGAPDGGTTDGGTPSMGDGGMTAAPSCSEALTFVQ